MTANDPAWLDYRVNVQDGSIVALSPRAMEWLLDKDTDDE